MHAKVQEENKNILLQNETEKVMNRWEDQISVEPRSFRWQEAFNHY